MIVAGVDVGNSTTEVAFARVVPGRAAGVPARPARATSGPKGSLRQRRPAVRELVDRGARRLGEPVARLLLAELRPVDTVAGRARAHDELDLGRTAVAVPASSTPAGSGVGVGALRRAGRRSPGRPAGPAIAIVGEVDFERGGGRAARRARARLGPARRHRPGRRRGADRQPDRRADLPIVDEVAARRRLPAGVLAAIEVAEPGGSVTELGDPLRLAVLLGLDPAEARGARNAARHVLGQPVRRGRAVGRPPRGQRVPGDAVGRAAVEADDTFSIPLPAPPATRPSPAPAPPPRRGHRDAARRAPRRTSPARSAPSWSATSPRRRCAAPPPARAPAARRS